VLTALQYIVQIFYSLSSQDIPEFFEDNLKEFMARPPGATPHRAYARPHRALRCGCGHRALGTIYGVLRASSCCALHAARLCFMLHAVLVSGALPQVLALCARRIHAERR
jgi:hypothetical protein